MPAAVLLAPGSTEATSAEFTISSTPVSIVAYTGTTVNIDYPGKVILQRKNLVGTFENFSTIYHGNILLKNDAKLYQIDFPGTYRVVRPDLTAYTDLTIGVEITDDSVIVP